jgi:molybdopterin-guanine dinucleotide biosynthesis protein A
LEITAVILVGGKSTRLGQDKVFVEIGGRPLIQRVVGRLESIAAHFVLVAAEPVADPMARYGVPALVVADRYPDKGSLGGLFTGLAAAPTEWSLVMATDMPFINPALIEHMTGLVEGYDLVLPVAGGQPQPTHALYSKRCLAPIERRVLADQLKMIGFHEEIRVRRVEEPELRQWDPDLLSFFNLNRPADLELARRMAAAESTPAAPGQA